MNARERAIEAACRFWQEEQGKGLSGAQLQARQAPLAGSVWWVEAHAPQWRLDVLVRRVEKHRFRCEPHCPFGYTVYACRKGGETPLALVTYAEEAAELIARLRFTRRYSGISLVALPNHEASWAKSVTAFLAQDALRRQAQAASRRERKASRRTTGYPVRSMPADGWHSWTLVPLPEDERRFAMRLPQRERLVELVCSALLARDITLSPVAVRNLRTHLDARANGDGFLPFGCLWTPVRCHWLTPGDPGSQLVMSSWRSWDSVSWCLRFEEHLLSDCSYRELEAWLR